MLVRFLSYLGKEGFGEQFHGEYEVGGVTAPCSIRWAAEPRGEAGKDNPLARVRDAGLLMQLYPDPLVPRVIAVVPCWNGLAVVSEDAGGQKLAAIERRPLPEPVILEVVRQVCLMLDRVYTRKDINTGEMLRTLHRAISTECIHVRPDGGIRVTGFEKMSTVWSARAAETSALATHPGARLAPEQMAGEVFHATDVYLAGLVAVDLLVNPERASQTARMLAMCICDPEGFEEIREQVLGDPAVEASANLRGLLRAMLQEDPKSRPSGHVIATMAAAVGASEPALKELAAGIELPTAPEGLFHQFVGRTLELPDPQLLPMPVDEDAEARTDAPAGSDPSPRSAGVEANTQDQRPAPITPPTPPPVATVTPRAAPAQVTPAEAPVKKPLASRKVTPAHAPEPSQAPAPAAAPAPAPAQAPARPTPVEPTPRPAPRPAPADPGLAEPIPEPIKPSPAKPSPVPPTPVVDQPLVAKPAKPGAAPAPAAPPAPADVEPVSRKSKLPMVLIAIAVLFLLACILCCGGVAIVLAF